MPLESVRKHAAEALQSALEAEFDLRPEEVAFEVPPRRDLGDLAWPGALPLARVLKRSPRQIAETLAEKTDWPDEVARVEIAGPGFINLFLERDRILMSSLAGLRDEETDAAFKTIVEHTNINPNKAAHIGHLRNAVLGDILVRNLRHLGADVEIQNYIDDTGVQVADVVVGRLTDEGTRWENVRGLEPCRRDELIERIMDRAPADVVPKASTSDFDDLCWDIYPKVTARYESEPDFAAHRAEVLHHIEAGYGVLDLEQAQQLLHGSVVAGESFNGRAVACLAAAVADGNVRCHLATMARLGIPYDVLPHESDILHLGFWSRAFEMLKEAGAT